MIDWVVRIIEGLVVIVFALTIIALVWGPDEYG